MLLSYVKYIKCNKILLHRGFVRSFKLKPKVLLTFPKNYSSGSKLQCQIEGVTSANPCEKMHTEIFGWLLEESEANLKSTHVCT